MRMIKIIDKAGAILVNIATINFAAYNKGDTEFFLYTKDKRIRFSYNNQNEAECCFDLLMLHFNKATQ